MQLTQSTLLAIIFASTSLALPCIHTRHDTHAFDMSTVGINLFSDANCQTNEYVFGPIEYGLDNALLDQGDYKSRTTDGTGTIGSYKLTRVLHTTEQLDFSMPSPAGLQHGPDGQVINAQCGAFLFSVGGNATGITPMNCYSTNSMATCFRLWHS